MWNTTYKDCWTASRTLATSWKGHVQSLRAVFPYTNAAAVCYLLYIRGSKRAVSDVCVEVRHELRTRTQEVDDLVYGELMIDTSVLSVRVL